MSIETVLRDMGFEDNEIQIYLYLLKKGLTTQQKISDESGILRQTVYEVVKKMESKGYVSTSLFGKRKEYSAIEPAILLNKIKEKEQDFEQILPVLQKMKNESVGEITSSSFTGIAGLKNLFELTLSSKSEIHWIANKNMSDKIFQGYYWHNYAQKRIEKKIPIKLIIEPTKKKDWNTDKKVVRDTRRNIVVADLDASFVLFDDNIIIYSLEKDKLFGVFIKSKAIKTSFEKIFNKLWDESK